MKVNTIFTIRFNVSSCDVFGMLEVTLLNISSDKLQAFTWLQHVCTQQLLHAYEAGMCFASLWDASTVLHHLPLKNVYTLIEMFYASIYQH